MKKFFKKFSQNKMYYSLVVVCVVAVCAVVTTVIKDNIDQSLQRKIALSGGSDIPNISANLPPSSEPYTAPVIAPKNTQTAKATATPVPTPTDEAAETFGSKFNIDKPVAGEIINAYSGDELVYDKTFEDWRVHRGIDLSAERSAPVKACANGVIDDVFVDPMDGITIVIDHGNHFKSIYKNLSSDKMVKKGESVEKGQAISGVGETGVSEAAMVSHIHFELMKKDEFVDPASYFE